MLNKQPFPPVFHQVFSVLLVVFLFLFLLLRVNLITTFVSYSFAGIEFHFPIKKKEKVVAKTTPRDIITLVSRLVFSYFVILSLFFDPFLLIFIFIIYTAEH